MAYNITLFDLLDNVRIQSVDNRQFIAISHLMDGVTRGLGYNTAGNNLDPADGWVWCRDQTITVANNSKATIVDINGVNHTINALLNQPPG
jgi:hypothetical protein